MIYPNQFDYLDAYFGSNGLSGEYIQVTVASNDSSDINVQDAALHICYNPREYFTTLFIEHVY